MPHSNKPGQPSPRRIDVSPDAVTVPIYTVTAGDTLRRIAERFYGDERHWKALAEANHELIVDPEQLRVGWVLKLPPLEER